MSLLNSNLSQTVAAALGAILVLSSCDGASRDDAPGVAAKGEHTTSPFAHIKAQPPGGKWIAEARTQRNLVREFKGTGTLYLVGVSLGRLIAVAHSAEISKVLIAKKDMAAYYDVVVRPEDTTPGTARLMLRSLVTDRLGLTVRPATEMRMTMVLSPAPGGVLIEASGSNEGILDLEEGQLKAVGSDITQLIALLGKDSKVPVVDETELPGRYNYRLEWDASKGAFAFIQSLGDIGLMLSPGLRPVESLVVSDAKFRADVAARLPPVPVQSATSTEQEETH
ncbi:MAG: TIGR03435 family protein [Myxococcota bacterium]|jgi:uncharacterized protein (TIGR03435 family)